MDPVANLREQRELVARIQEMQDREEYDIDMFHELQEASFRLAELVLALDGWRLAGGFDPYR